MNPWAAFVILLALGVIIIGYKGTQRNAIAAVVGHKVGKTTWQ